MMEYHFTERYTKEKAGYDGMYDGDDGGSSDLVENEDQYKPYSWDDGVYSPMISPLLRTARAAAGTHEVSSEDDLDEFIQMNSPSTVTAAAGTHEVSSEDELDEFIQMNSPSTVTAAAGTHEQRSRDTHIDIPEGNSDDERKGWDLGLILAITTVVLESMAAIFTQLSYALLCVILSYIALLICMIEIIYEDRGTLSNNRSQRGKSFATLNNIVALACALGKSFATLNNIVALACALGECVVTTINYRFKGLIKLTVLPIILADGVLLSKIYKYWQRSRTSIRSKKAQ